MVMIPFNRFFNVSFFREFFQIPCNDVYQESDYCPGNTREK